MTVDGVLERIRELLPGIRDRRAEIEQARRLPADLAGQLRATGIFRLSVPRSIGGAEVSPTELMRVSETVCRLKAIATPSPGADNPSPDALRQFARGRLVSYKVPRVFEVRPSLPMSATGKVLRHMVEADDARKVDG